MNKPTHHYLYKIYYYNQDYPVYIGRTNQSLKDRLRGHFYKKPLHRVIELNNVSKIEYAEFETEADMFLYEIYYINIFKPTLNCDDVARDNLTVSLPDVIFTEYKDKIIDKWKQDLLTKDIQHKHDLQKHLDLIMSLSKLRKLYHSEDNIMTEDEYYREKEKIENELTKLTNSLSR